MPKTWQAISSVGRAFVRLLAFCLIGLFSIFESLCQGASVDFKARADAAFTKAEQAHLEKPTNPTNAWIFARACFDLAEFSKTHAEREQLAKKGIVAAQAAINSDPKIAAGHYYLAMNKGQLARTKTLGALPLVEQMEKEFQAAAQLDKNFDYAGPDRSLGLLYLDAPGWPTSIGNKKRARQHLEHALTLHPEFPENHLCLLEYFLRTKDKIRGRALLPEAERVMKEAKADLTGERWEQSWVDWEKRWKVVQEELR